MPRNFQNVKTSYWESARFRDVPLTTDEMCVELFLVTCPMCGPSGIILVAPDTIAEYTGVGNSTGDNHRDLWGNTQVQTTLKALVEKKRIRLYRGGWIWVIGKWEHESKSPQMQKALIAELGAVPAIATKDFMSKYRDTIIEKIPQTLLDKAIDTPSDTLTATLTDSDPDATPDAIISLNVNTHVQDKNQDQNKTSNPDGFPAPYEKLVIDLFPHLKEKRAERDKQVKALDGLIRLDHKHIGSNYTKAAWEHEVFSVLKWMRSDVKASGTFPGWSAVFRSIPRLRVNACEKFLNAQAAYHRSVEFPSERPVEETDDGEVDKFLDDFEGKANAG